VLGLAPGAVYVFTVAAGNGEDTEAQLSDPISIILPETSEYSYSY